MNPKPKTIRSEPSNCPPCSPKSQNPTPKPRKEAYESVEEHGPHLGRKPLANADGRVVPGCRNKLGNAILVKSLHNQSVTYPETLVQL